MHIETKKCFLRLLVASRVMAIFMVDPKMQYCGIPWSITPAPQGPKKSVKFDLINVMYPCYVLRLL